MVEQPVTNLASHWLEFIQWRYFGNVSQPVLLSVPFFQRAVVCRVCKRARFNLEAAFIVGCGLLCARGEAADFFWVFCLFAVAVVWLQPIYSSFLPAF